MMRTRCLGEGEAYRDEIRRAARALGDGESREGMDSATKTTPPALFARGARQSQPPRQNNEKDQRLKKEE